MTLLLPVKLSVFFTKELDVISILYDILAANFLFILFF